MTQEHQDWAELTPTETLKGAGHLYRNLACLVVFGVFKNGSVGTVFTDNASPMQLMWTLKAMDWDAVSENDDPLPLTQQAYGQALKHAEDETQFHPVTRRALAEMKDLEHVIIAGLTEKSELTMATSKDVNFMMTNFCIDWFRHQLLNQISPATTFNTGK